MSLRPSMLPRLLRPQAFLQNAPVLRTRAIHPPARGTGSVREVCRSTHPRPRADATQSPPQSQIIRTLRQQQQQQQQHTTRRFNSSKPNSNSNSNPKPEPEPTSFSNRMRKLSREYGWAALGVYLLLSALDFPFCFAAVRLLGVDRIGHLEAVVVDSIRGVLPGGNWNWGRESEKTVVDDVSGGEPAVEGEPAGDGRESRIAVAERRNRGEEASIWTQLALAYAIHKSFIFIRVPLTAAVTPKVVKVLRRWGWDIGKRKPKGT